MQLLEMSCYLIISDGLSSFLLRNYLYKRNFKKETQIWNLKSAGGIFPFSQFSGKLVESPESDYDVVQVRTEAITFHLASQGRLVSLGMVVNH